MRKKGNQKSPGRPAGFTLLEIMVVIAIISVMAIMLVPYLGDNSRNTRDAAEGLALLMNMAQQEAVMTSRIWQLELDPENKRYRFKQLTGVDFTDVSTRPLAGEHDLDGLDMAKLRINGQAINSGTGQVFFFPTGEQDVMQMEISSGDEDYLVAMGPVGPATSKQL